MDDESDFSILVSRQETRFQHQENSNSKEIDIKGLNITVTSNSPTNEPTKRKKNHSQSKDILVDASLRLKHGVRYGLVGRNGTGKSTLVTAIADRLIPGLSSSSITISSMNQIGGDDEHQVHVDASGSNYQSVSPKHRTALEFVIESDDQRRTILQELQDLSSAMEEGSGAQLKAFRQIQYSRLRDRLARMEKDAKLRSGARGFKARQDLASFEKVVQDAERRMHNLQDQDPAMEAAEIQAASDMLSNLQARADSFKDEDVNAAAVNILKGLGFKASRMAQTYTSLSGGWKMRCQLAAVLIRPSDLILLDEPTNYLDLAGIVWLENYLKHLNETRGSAIVVVSHDRAFLDNVCEELIVLRNQKLSYFRGTLSEYENNRGERKLYMMRMKAAIERQKEHMQKTIAENIKQGKKTGDQNRLKQAKSRQKRVDERTGMQVNEKGFRFKISRDQGMIGDGPGKRPTAVVPQDDRPINFTIPQAAELRFPGPLLSLESVTYRYPAVGSSASNAATVLEDVTLSVHVGDRVGILGLNGAGKSTLIKVLVGELKPTKGTVTAHPRLKLGYYSQHAVEELRTLAASQTDGGTPMTALRLLAKECGGAMSEGNMRGLLGSFGLAGRTASDVPIAKLSGGQLVRLALIRIVWDHPHLLILDEISTHLDFDSVNALKEALVDYDGAVILVSHDRYLVKWVVEGGDADDTDDEDVDENEAKRGKVYFLQKKTLRELEGGVDDFERDLEKTLKI